MANFIRQVFTLQFPNRGELSPQDGQQSQPTTGQDLDKDDSRKRDLEAKIDRLHYTNAIEKQRWKTLMY